MRFFNYKKLELFNNNKYKILYYSSIFLRELSNAKLMC